MNTSDPEIFERLAALLKQSRKVALATVVHTEGSAPREPGARMLVFPDGGTEGTVGGGILEKSVIDEALGMLENNVPWRKVRYDLTEEDAGGIGAACGGAGEVFIEVFGEKEKVLICGGGHVGEAVSRFARETGFSVTVVEDRPEFSGADRFPRARILNVRPDDPAVLGGVDASTAVVIVSRSHEMDHDFLKRLVHSSAFYVGMIGSKRKVAAIFSALEKAGTPRELMDKVYAPIGLDIDAESPEEIAISILGEIISVRKSGQPSAISLKHKAKA
jgi:xanthine dehydrogenase accessory factor